MVEWQGERDDSFARRAHLFTKTVALFAPVLDEPAITCVLTRNRRHFSRFWSLPLPPIGLLIVSRCKQRSPINTPSAQMRLRVEEMNFDVSTNWAKLSESVKSSTPPPRRVGRTEALRFLASLCPVPDRSYVTASDAVPRNTLFGGAA